MKALKKLKSILLIDDNEIDNFINRKIIENYGRISVSEFTSTRLALEYLADVNQLPEMIFLDINLPIMDGFEFLSEYGKLNKEKKSTEIVMLSASCNPKEIEAARQNENCMGFMEKPLTKQKLSQLFNRLSHRKL